MWRAFTRIVNTLESVGQTGGTTLTQQFQHSRNQYNKVSKANVTNYLSLHNRAPPVIKFRENMSSEKPKVVFVLGGPGAGKGTQCSKIVDRFQFTHLSAGDLLREERAREGSEFGQLIEDYIRNGKIVPVEVTCSLLENAMKSSGKSRFLIDGFPRNQDNLDGWNRQMDGKADMQFCSSTVPKMCACNVA